MKENSVIGGIFFDGKVGPKWKEFFDGTARGGVKFNSSSESISRCFGNIHEAACKTPPVVYQSIAAVAATALVTNALCSVWTAPGRGGGGGPRTKTSTDTSRATTSILHTGRVTQMTGPNEPRM